MGILPKPKRAVFFLLYTVLLLLLIEGSSRAFWVIKRGVGFFNPKDIIYSYYPEIREVKKKQIYPDDGYFDVLLLGGSVLGDKGLKQVLLEGLKDKTNGRVRIHDVAKIGHASLDSYHKYNYLLDKHFDLVVFYHAINELRANNCPPWLFRSDYSHYSWYNEINILKEHKEINLLTFPYSFNFIWIRGKQALAFLLLGFLEHVPGYNLKQELVKYGGEIKTAAAFKQNLVNILEIASSKRERVLLMTFSFYVPEDYSLAEFNRHKLDYGRHRCAIETWGKPANVIAGISTHNAIIEEVAKDRHNVIFVDQDKLIPKRGQYFDDICHLTHAGCQRFVSNMLKAVM